MPPRQERGEGGGARAGTRRTLRARIAWKVGHLRLDRSAPLLFTAPRHRRAPLTAGHRRSPLHRSSAPLLLTAPLDRSSAPLLLTAPLDRSSAPLLFTASPVSPWEGGQAPRVYAGLPCRHLVALRLELGELGPRPVRLRARGLVRGAGVVDEEPAVLVGQPLLLLLHAPQPLHHTPAPTPSHAPPPGGPQPGHPPRGVARGRAAFPHAVDRHARAARIPGLGGYTGRGSWWRRGPVRLLNNILPTPNAMSAICADGGLGLWRGQNIVQQRVSLR